MSQPHKAEIQWKTKEQIEREREAQAWMSLRSKRDALLSASDWTQLPDAPLTQEQRNNWQLYRQALRDIPQQFGAPYKVKWPKSPE